MKFGVLPLNKHISYATLHNIAVLLNRMSVFPLPMEAGFYGQLHGNISLKYKYADLNGKNCDILCFIMAL